MNTVECKSFAVVENEQLRALADVLRGLCTRYKSFMSSETALEIPLASGTKTTTLRLIKRPEPGGNTDSAWQEPRPERMLARHEGLPMQTPAARLLPAAVRDVQESYCQGPGQLQFWKALGARQLQHVDKNGNEYHCVCDGHDICASLFNFSCTLPGAAPIPHSSFVLELTVRVAEGQHVAGSHALGNFAQKLQPYVTMQPAMAPV